MTETSGNPENTNSTMVYKEAESTCDAHPAQKLLKSCPQTAHKLRTCYWKDSVSAYTKFTSRNIQNSLVEMSVCVCMHVCLFVCVCVVCLCLFAVVHVCVLCACDCLLVCMCVCTYVCMHVHVYVCVLV